jgi:DNA-binding transcriptional LysR family regulator
VHADAVAAVPAAHRDFLAGLPLWHRSGEMLFVHAGIRPGVALEAQDETDLVWIREPFLSDPRDHGALVVHGHTTVDDPEHRGNRVCIDTGAGYGGPVTAIVTEGRDICVLTEAGRRLHGRVAGGFDVIEAGLADLVDHAANFVLAAHPGVAQLWLVPRLDELTEAIGGADLRLWLFDRDSELRGGGFDAAIRIGDGTFEGLDARLLFREVVVPVASPALAERYGLTEHSTADDVYAAPFVHMDDGDHPWVSWSDWLSEFGIVLRRQPGRVLFHNYPMVLQRALLGHGVALGWRTLIDEYIEGGALVVVGPEVRSSNGYYITWPSGRPSEPVQRLIDWLAERS